MTYPDEEPPAAHPEDPQHPEHAEQIAAGFEYGKDGPRRIVVGLDGSRSGRGDGP